MSGAPRSPRCCRHTDEGGDAPAAPLTRNESRLGVPSPERRRIRGVQDIVSLRLRYSVPVVFLLQPGGGRPDAADLASHQQEQVSVALFGPLANSKSAAEAIVAVMSRMPRRAAMATKWSRDVSIFATTPRKAICRM